MVKGTIFPPSILILIVFGTNPQSSEPTAGNIRACGFCCKDNQGEHDACISGLPGVDNACCGHGIKEQSYVQFTNGVELRGFMIGHKV